MSEIIVGEWIVTGQCTICGAPFLSKCSYKLDEQGDQDKPITVNSCSCFKNQEKIFRPENSVSRMVKLRTADNKGEEEYIYTVTSTNPNDKIEISESGNFTVTPAEAATITIGSRDNHGNLKAAYDPHNMGEM
jgi:hypothetical protein